MQVSPALLHNMLKMRLLLYLCIALLCLPMDTVLAQQTTFSKVFSNYTLDPENGWSILETEDGYLMVSAGECFGQDAIICGVISKLDKNGDLVWFKQLDYYPRRHNSIHIFNNKIYLSGATNIGDGQFKLYCLDLDGNILWDKVFGSPTQDEADATFIFTSDNHIIMYGTRRPNIAGLPLLKIYVVKTDTEGNFLEDHTYDFQNNQSLGRTVIESSDLQTVFSYIACESCFFDVLGGVASINSSGNLNWNLELPKFFQPDSPNIIQSGSEELVVNWHTATKLVNHDLDPPALFYLDISGHILDSVVFENQSLKSISDLEPLWNKGLVGCGDNYINYLTQPNAPLAGWVFRLDENREILWERNYLDTLYQGRSFGLKQVLPTTDGGYIATGTITNFMTGVWESHNWILKLDSMGCLNPGCGAVNYVTNTDEMVFLKGKEIKIYPNPADQHINVVLPDHLVSPKTTISIVSNSGLVVKKVMANTKEMQVNLSGIPSGIYYVVIMMENEVITSQRIVISR